MHHVEDLDLARQALRGDPDAVSRLGRRLSCVTHIIAHRNAAIGRPLEANDLEDAQQDAVMVIWRKLGEFEGRSSLNTWIYQICNLEFMSAVRRRRRERCRRDSNVDPTAFEDPAGAELNRVQDLYRGMSRLNDEERFVIRMKHYESRTFDDIALRMQMSPSQIKTRYYRAMTRLRSLMCREPAEEATER